MKPTKTNSVALPELERMLAGTASANIKKGRRGLPRPRHVVALGLACMALGGTAVAADIWNPGIGTNVDSAPTIATTAVPTDLTDALGVFRREPNALDRGPEVEKTLSNVSDYYVKGLRPDSVRYLEPSDDPGEAVILFSTEGSVFTNGEAACVATPPGGVANAAVTEATADCFGLDRIMAGEAVSTIEKAGENGWGESYGLVPDRVESGTAEFPNGTEIEIPVIDNHFESKWVSAEVGIYNDVDSTPTQVGPTRIVWHTADGELVYEPSR